MFQKLKRTLNNQYLRDAFVFDELKKLPNDIRLLDAGAGSQRYRSYCHHVQYLAQDFAQYKTDDKHGFTDRIGGKSGYNYGPLDYTGDIWAVQEKDSAFDAILCTEVFEHIPFPIETIREFSRLLKPGGKLILTAPFSSLRHMDPYYFYSGFSDHFYEKILGGSGFTIERCEPVGDYYRFLAVELARSIRQTPFSFIFLIWGFLYYYFRKPTAASKNTLCMGYHVVATKKTTDSS